MQAIYAELEASSRDAAMMVGQASYTQAELDEIDAATRAGTLQDMPEYRTGDGSHILDPRAQAAYEGRVNWSTGEVRPPVYSDEQASALAQVEAEIAGLEALATTAETVAAPAVEEVNAAAGLTGEAFGILTDQATGLHFGLGALAGTATGAGGAVADLGAAGAGAAAGLAGEEGLAPALAEAGEGVEAFANSPGWQSAKDNLKALLIEGQSWGETWRNILEDAMDRVFDLAFSPAWDQLWQNLELSFAGGGGGPNVAQGTGAGGGIVGGIADWFGNLPGFDTGGAFTVRGRAGIDRNVAAVRLSEGEEVEVRRCGQAGAPTVVVNITTPDLRSFQASRAQIGRAVAAGQRGA